MERTLITNGKKQIPKVAVQKGKAKEDYLGYIGEICRAAIVIMLKPWSEQALRQNRRLTSKRLIAVCWPHVRTTKYGA